jgi:Polyketide cyclase / dehydrase and lipid transport
VSVSAASYAPSSAAAVSHAERALRARHPVLLMNLKSGGGKAERFRLVDLCRQQHRADRPAARRGPAPAGRGRTRCRPARHGWRRRLAGTRRVASQHSIPFVVVPAGTRNHFPLDLGLDHADVLVRLAQHHPGSRSWLTDSTAGSILRGTRRRLCSVRVGVSTLIWVLARLEELMDIRFRDTQSANASAETLFEVITDYSHYPHFNPAVVDVSVAESSNNGVEFTASRTPRILRDVRARDRYKPA